MLNTLKEEIMFELRNGITTDSLHFINILSNPIHFLWHEKHSFRGKLNEKRYLLQFLQKTTKKEHYGFPKTHIYHSLQTANDSLMHSVGTEFYALCENTISKISQ